MTETINRSYTAMLELPQQSDTPTIHDLLTNCLARQEAARLCQMEASKAQAEADYAEQQLKLAMLDAGVKTHRDDLYQMDVTVVTRRDVRIDDMTEFTAALTEAGMTIPMTEPRPDTAACKKVAKVFPDLPGVTPTETTYLKWTGHQ